MKKLIIFIFSVVILCGTFTNSALAGLEINGIASPARAEIEFKDQSVTLRVEGSDIMVSEVDLYIRGSEIPVQLIAQNVSTNINTHKFSIDISLVYLDCTEYTIEVYEAGLSETPLETGTFKVIQATSLGKLNVIAETADSIESTLMTMEPRTLDIQLRTVDILSQVNIMELRTADIQLRTGNIESAVDTILVPGTAEILSQVNTMEPRTADIQLRTGAIETAVNTMLPITGDIADIQLRTGNTEDLLIDIEPRIDTIEITMTSLENTVDSIVRELGEERYCRRSRELSGILPTDVLVLDPAVDLSLSADESVRDGELNVSANISLLEVGSTIILLSRLADSTEIPLAVIKPDTASETVVLTPRKVRMEDTTGIYARVVPETSTVEVEMIVELYYKVQVE